MDLFLRTYVAGFLAPTPLITLTFLVGTVLLWIKRNSRVGHIVITAGLLGLIFFGLDPATEYLLNKTENEFKGFNGTHQKIRYVVVLAGGYNPSVANPLSSQLTHQTLVRLVEGIKIYREMDGTRLVLTGKGWAPEKSEATAMKEMAIALGVSPQDIITEEESLNTLEHTRNLAGLLGKAPFVLVTSALHMPRAIRAFERAGLMPVAAPTGHVLTGDYQGLNFSRPFVTADNLLAIDDWFFEFWARRKYE